MSHGLATATDMLYVGATPWHKLGVRCETAPSVAEALTLANLGWAVSTQQIALAGDFGRIIDSHRAVVRSDNGKVLGVVTKKWHPVQNSETFAVLDPLVKSGDVAIETAGQLDGGERVWALARIMRDPIQVTPGDAVVPYILLANSHCGDLAWTGMFTSVRVVCANTLGGALRGEKDARKAMQLLKHRHTKGVGARVADASAAIDLAHRTFTHAAEGWSMMSRKQMRESTLKDYFRQVFPPKPVTKDEPAAPPESSPRPVAHGLLESIAANTADPSRATVADIAAETELRDQRALDTCLDLFMREESPAARGSLWAAVNAVTKYATHERGRTDESRASALLGGEGHAIIERAFTAARCAMV